MHRVCLWHSSKKVSRQRWTHTTGLPTLYAHPHVAVLGINPLGASANWSRESSEDNQKRNTLSPLDPCMKATAHLQDQAICLVAQAGDHLVNHFARPEQRPKVFDAHAECFHFVLVHEWGGHEFLRQQALDVPGCAWCVSMLQLGCPLLNASISSLQDIGGGHHTLLPAAHAGRT